MALTAAEEALVRELIAQNPELLSLAGNEATIISKLGATKKNLSQLAAALSLNDTDLLFTRQGTSDKSVALSVLKAFVVAGVPAASETVSGISELATTAEATAGTDDLRIMTPLKVAQSIAANTSSASVRGATSNLRISTTGTNANVTITADEIVVKSATNTYVTVRSISHTINSAASGANGLDTGAIAGNTWYFIFEIWNGVTAAGLLSLSETAPTLPSGYTHKALVGAVRTDGTANKYPLSMVQFGKDVQYKLAAGSNLTAFPAMASGVNGSPTTPTWVALAIANFVPSTAMAISIVTVNNNTSTSVIVAPNASYGAVASTTAPALATMSPQAGGGTFSYKTNVLLESSNIYVASSSASGSVLCVGWRYP